MPSFTGTVELATGDFYYSRNPAGSGSLIKQSGTNTIIAEYNNGTNTDKYAEALIQTSGLTETYTESQITITAATLHWYNSSYAKSKSATFGQSTIEIRPNAINPYTTIYSLSSDPADGTWGSHTLESGEFQYISFTGNTEIKWIVDDPGGTYYATWELGAYENSTSAYLVVDYTITTPSTTRKRIFIIG